MGHIQLLIAFLVISVVSAKDVECEELKDLINYEDLNHTIELQGFRAGNHDVSGLNDYFFKVDIYALAILKEERKKEFKDRLKVQRNDGQFGDIQLKTLSFWQKTNPPPSLDVQGEEIRDLMSEAMRTFQVAENQVAILATIQLYEKNKQFIFFGQDLLVGEVSYHIIPESIPHQPKIENKTIEINDKLGTMVKLQLKFDTLDPKKKKKK